MDFIIPYEYKNIFSTALQAKQINEIMLKYVDSDAIITDATSCIGGNSYFFCKDFKFVNCVEKNENTHRVLIKNLKNFKNCIIYNCSFNDVKFLLRQDVVFIDPPWGGSVYKNKKKIDLFLDSQNICDIIDSMYNYVKIIAVKVPNNYNKLSLTNNFWENKTYPITKNGKSLYKLIILYKPI